MTENVAVELIKMAVELGAVVTAYLKLRSKMGHEHEQTRSQLDANTEINRFQIAASNNFNQKIEKLQSQTTLIAREVHAVREDVKKLSEGTGIAIGD